jgi:uncharacterized NAD-dependent epimerase/dehydratase family protein
MVTDLNGFRGWIPVETPLVVLSEGCFGTSQSKLALGVMRYGQWPTVAVIDSTQSGQTVRSLTGIACEAPLVASFAEALRLAPKALLLGTAPPGGQLPPVWLAVIRDAIRAGLHIINGLHFFLSEEPELVALAAEQGVRLWDVRDPEAYGHHKFQVINLQKPRPANVQVITMVGTDCSVGKMHTALELHAWALAQGHSSAFIATGQTGILIAGDGVPLDRVIGDFMAGALEVCIHEEIARLEQTRPGAKHLIFVEGQGSLMHPAYSGVTLSLLHGSNPDAMILCHKPDQSAVRNYSHLALPNLTEVIARYEAAAVWCRPAGALPPPVLGVSLNTSMFSDERAAACVAQLQQETGLPVTDPVRYGVAALFEKFLGKSIA